MTFRTKAFGALLAAGMAAAMIAFLQFRPSPTASVLFLGWTNVSGRTHASLLFNPVTKSKPHKNYVMFEFYRVGLDFTYTDENSRTNTGLLRQNVYFYPHLAGIYHLPVPTNAITLHFVRAEAWLERRWDNIRLPFRLPSRHFSFTPPVISSEQMKELQRSKG